MTRRLGRSQLTGVAAGVLLLAGCSTASPSTAPSAVGATTAPTGRAVDGAPSAGPDAPVVRRTDLTITYRLEGSSAAGVGVPLGAEDQFVVTTSEPAGSQVAKGQRVAQAVLEPAVAQALTASAASSRLDKGTLDRLRGLEGPVVAPITGRLGQLAGRPAVLADGIDVVVGLTPLQQLRYRSLAFTGVASIETVVGERQVTCEAIWLTAVQPSTDDASDADVAQLHCRLPRYVETAPGLRARLTLTSATIEDAVVVPNLALSYDSAADGYSVTIIEGGVPRTVPVVTGVTDGVVRVVTSPLTVGAVLVLPTAAAT